MAEREGTNLQELNTPIRNRYIYVNGEHLMANGHFVENPFHKTYRLTRIVGYLMANPEKSKKRIRIIMGRTGYKRYTDQVIDDIYGYSMDFFSEHVGIDFRPNYHNSTNYRIEQYVNEALRVSVRSYNQAKLLNKKTRESNIIDQEEEDLQYTSGTITSRNFEAPEDASSRTELGYYYECFDYLMALVYNTKPQRRELTPELVYDVFLSGHDSVNIRRQITRREGYFELNDVYYEEVHQEHGMTKRQVNAWMKRLKESEDYEPFREMVYELVIPITEGNFMREDVIGMEFQE